MFEELCPGEEFLPTPPDPKDIVYETPSADNDVLTDDPNPADNSDSCATGNVNTDSNPDDNSNNTDPGEFSVLHI